MIYKQIAIMYHHTRWLLYILIILPGWYVWLFSRTPITNVVHVYMLYLTPTYDASVLDNIISKTDERYYSTPNMISESISQICDTQGDYKRRHLVHNIDIAHDNLSNNTNSIILFSCPLHTCTSSMIQNSKKILTMMILHGSYDIYSMVYTNKLSKLVNYI